MSPESVDRLRWEFRNRQRHFDETGRHDPIHQLLREVIDTATLSLQDGVRKVMASEELSSSLPDSVLEFAARTDRTNHFKLATFVLEIYKLTDNESEPAEPVIWWWWRHLNIELPQSWAANHDPYDEILEEGRQWATHWAFLARLSGIVYNDDPTLHERPKPENRPWIDMTGLAFHPLGDAFGFPCGQDRFNRIKSEHATRCACWFLVLDAEQLWAYCKTDFSEYRKSRRELPNWHLGLWRHWKQGVLEAQSRDFGEDTRQLLDEALAEMDRVDAEDVIPETGGKWW